MTNYWKEESVISYIDCLDTLNKIVEIMIHAKTRDSLFHEVMKEVKERLETLSKNESIDKQQLKKIGDELLRRQKERYEQRVMSS